MSQAPKLEPRVICPNTTLKISPGEVVSIVGHEGSGRSMFLQSLLGETHLKNGQIFNSSKITFISLHGHQGCWFHSRSLLYNIILPHDLVSKDKKPRLPESDWKNFLEICDRINLDLGKFDERELTVVRKGALNFSKAERIKIMLARALYHNSDIFIFDHIFNKDLAGCEEIFKSTLEILKGKTILCTTNYRKIVY